MLTFFPTSPIFVAYSPSYMYYWFYSYKTYLLLIIFFNIYLYLINESNIWWMNLK
jgi:hypothetical protein